MSSISCVVHPHLPMIEEIEGSSPVSDNRCIELTTYPSPIHPEVMLAKAVSIQVEDGHLVYETLINRLEMDFETARLTVIDHAEAMGFQRIYIVREDSGGAGNG